MGERKVINKYYPPDFDPLKVPKGKRPAHGQMKIRMMLPMSVQCNTCGEFMYRGKKFNSRKEIVEGEEYLGIKIHRFYMKCTRCSAEFTIKTDPKNADYVSELGASRNFEPWRENSKAIEEAEKEREREEMGDAMKALENRTVDNRLEMDILDALDEIRSINARTSKVTPEQLEKIINEAEERQRKKDDEEDEAITRAAFMKGEPEGDDPYESHLPPPSVKKIQDEDDSDDYGLLKRPRTEESMPESKPPSSSKPPPVSVKVQVKAKVIPKAAAPVPPAKPQAPKVEEASGLLGLLDYTEDDDE
eukprot:TRINITY_DN2049_c0_g1_i2.p1 TRINITY_DN2049_c0_g1~~TRINITY_DN2049_c0_g1_i2.p1  ORF type:complete len:304 (+),score=74.69 TRINITY_DN2049_c0_g1_i2:186-1097(+)